MFLNAVGISLTVEKARDLASLIWYMASDPIFSEIPGEGLNPQEDGYARWLHLKAFLEENGYQLDLNEVLDFLINLLKFIKLCIKQEKDMELRAKQEVDVRDNM